MTIGDIDCSFNASSDKVANGKPLKISRILHAGYLFECDNVQIAFDTIFENPFSRNCHAFPSVRFDHDQIRQLNLAAVFISHFHDDHCSLESLNYLNRQTPIYLYCIFDEMFAMIRALGFTQVHSLQLDVGVTVGPFEVIARRALDAEVDSMFHVRAAGLNVLNVVDSWIDPSILDTLARFVPWDMVMWPFQTMLEIDVLTPSRASPASGDIPQEWIEQINVLQPRYLVPSSCQFVQEPWSWYNRAMFPISYRRFNDILSEAVPYTRVIRMNPSVSITLDATGIVDAPSLAWVLPVGEQNIDFEYDPTLPAPATAEVAQHFPPLSAPETERVLAFCRAGILEKYCTLEPPDDPYFATPRLWRLSVYDHAGQGTHFHYLVSSDTIEPALPAHAPLAWATEVPLGKLYSALETGESLTSMYMRINDTTFTPDIEAELQEADFLDDPLIRCLFDGAFGAYQREQLKRLGLTCE